MQASRALGCLGFMIALSGCLEIGDPAEAQGDQPGSGPGVRGSFGVDDEGNIEGSVEVHLLEAATAETDVASRALTPVSEVRLLGYSASSDFHRGGAIQVSVLPLDVQGHGIISSDVYVSMGVECEVGFAMSGSVSISATEAADRARPFQFGVGMDASGSMTTTDPNRYRVPAGQSFVSTIQRSSPGSEFGLVEFADEVVEQSPLTTDVPLIQAAMANVGSDGSTRLHDAALSLVNSLSARRKTGYQQAVLLLSDGMDTASDHSRSDAINAARAARIPIHAITLGGALDVPGLSFVGDLQEYAHATGGLFVHVGAANRLERAFENLALGTAEGRILLDVRLTGGVYLPFSTCTVELDVHAGGQAATTSFDLVMPMK